MEWKSEGYLGAGVTITPQGSVRSNRERASKASTQLAPAAHVMSLI